MNEGHPREETEKSRTYRRRQLRTWAEDKLMRRGSPIEDPLGVFHILGSSLRFDNGQDGYMMRLKERTGGIDKVILNIYHENDRMGPFTQYTSNRPGEFTRADLNPRDSGAPAQQELEEMDETEGALAIHLGSLATALVQAETQQAGIDGQPITAQEALEVLERLKSARVLGG